MENVSSDINEALDEALLKIVKPCEKCGGSGRRRNGWCSCHQLYEHIVEYAWAGIPKDYWELKLSTFPGDKEARILTRDYIKRITEFRREGLGIYFVGNYGRGKTSLGIQILMAAIRRKFTAHYKTFSQIITELFNREDKAEWEEEMMADFLFIDELGKEHQGSGWEFKRALFDETIRKRKGKKLVTIIASNIQFEQIDSRGSGVEDIYGGSIYSVLKSMLYTVTVKGVDMREGMGEEKFLRIMEQRDE